MLPRPFCAVVLSAALAFSLILAAATSLAQATTPTEAAGPTETETEPERGAVLAPVHGYVDSWNAHDGQALGATFTADADFVGISGTWWHGAAEIGRVHAELFSGRYSDSAFTLDGTPQVAMLAPDVALAHWRWTISKVRDEAGSEMPPYSGLFTTVLIREKDAWRIRAGQNNVVD